MAECQDCKMKDRILRLEHHTTDQEARLKILEEKASKDSADKKELYNRFDDLALDNQRHDLNIKNVYDKLESIDRKVCEMNTSITAINNKPAKTMDKFTSAVISAVGSAVGVAIIGLIAFMVLKTL